MSEKKPESEPKKKSILDELRNFQIASLAIQHQAGIPEPLENFDCPGLVRNFKYLKILWSGLTRDFGSTFYHPMTVGESLMSGKIGRFHQRKSSVWRSIDSMSSGKAK